ncbi:MAG: hypothetical protein ABI895_18325 [Deltaproteobacteria bacterium]
MSDYLALAVEWNGSAGSFLKSEQLPRLAKKALATMGFDLDAMGIQIVHSKQRPGGAAYGVSIPDDVRFTGHFPDGFEGARGYFHELGHAVHMKSIKPRFLPMRMLPQNIAFSEGIGEIFTLPVQNSAWLASELPGVTTEQLEGLAQAMAAFRAVAVRYNCLHALTELALFESVSFKDAFTRAMSRTFDDPEAPVVYVLAVYLDTPLLSMAYVHALNLKYEFERRLEPRAFLSPEGGAFLRQTLLEPGNSLSLDDWARR